MSLLEIARKGLPDVEPHAVAGLDQTWQIVKEWADELGVDLDSEETERVLHLMWRVGSRMASLNDSEEGIRIMSFSAMALLWGRLNG